MIQHGINVLVQFVLLICTIKMIADKGIIVCKQISLHQLRRGINNECHGKTGFTCIAVLVIRLTKSNNIAWFYVRNDKLCRHVTCQVNIIIGRFRIRIIAGCKSRLHMRDLRQLFTKDTVINCTSEYRTIVHGTRSVKIYYVSIRQYRWRCDRFQSFLFIRLSERHRTNCQRRCEN